MKRNLLAIVLVLFLTTIGYTQTTTRNMVVAEISTGTWCQWCPYAAMGVDDMLENGDSVAVIENHNGDTYATTASNSRNTLYNVAVFPSAAFDGALGTIGVSGATSQFPYYHSLYLQRKAIPSPVTIEMSETHTDLDYDVTITLTRLSAISASNMKLLFAVTESHIAKNWWGQTELNFVNRKMVPDASGTAVSFSSGSVQTFHLTFSMDPSWRLPFCEFVAFLQNMDTGQGDIPGTSYPPYGSMHKYEIFQGTKYAVTPLTSDFIADVTSLSTNGSVQFTNLVKGGFMFVPTTYNWSFPGATPDHSTDANPVVSYTECGTHDVTLVVTAAGQTDTKTKTEYISVTQYVNIVAIPYDTACSPQNITLNGTILNGASYLWSPGGETTAMITIDPLVVGLGSHTYILVATSLDGCSNSDTTTIVFQDCTGINALADNFNASVYPNPNHGSFTLEINSKKIENVEMNIINPLGNTVYSENILTIPGKFIKEIRMNDVSPGIYFMNIQSGDKKISQKVFVY
jgi:PKD repeat protein